MNPWWKRTNEDPEQLTSAAAAPEEPQPASHDDAGAQPKASAAHDPAGAEANAESTRTATTAASKSDDTAPSAEAAAEPDAKPKPRRRAPRRSAASRTAATKAAATDSEADGEDSREKPKPPSRRTTRSSASAASGDAESDSTVSDSTVSDSAVSDSAVSREAAPKPRRRAPRRRAASSPAKATEAEARETPTDDTREVPAKRPSRRRPARSRQPSETAIEAFESGNGTLSELAEVLRELLTAAPDQPRTVTDERKIALFCDFENVALGLRESEIPKFDIHLVLERLLEKGKIIVKKAYADWERYSEYKKTLHGAAIELIDIPQKYYSGKNSADIKMVVDAMEMSFAKEHLDTFVVLSGDSDFSPLVSKLKENNKHVIGVGMKNSSSKLLIDNCDEFIFYEDIWRDSQRVPKLEGLDKKNSEVFSLMTDSIQALIRENKDVLWGSMVKQTMQRKRPAFNEGYFGYHSFSELLEDAERRKIINLKKDHRSGSYIVTGFVREK